MGCCSSSDSGIVPSTVPRPRIPTKYRVGDTIWFYHPKFLSWYPALIRHDTSSSSPLMDPEAPIGHLEIYPITGFEIFHRHPKSTSIRKGSWYSLCPEPMVSHKNGHYYVTRLGATANSQYLLQNRISTGFVWEKLPRISHFTIEMNTLKEQIPDFHRLNHQFSQYRPLMVGTRVDLQVNNFGSYGWVPGLVYQKTGHQVGVAVETPEQGVIGVWVSQATCHLIFAPEETQVFQPQNPRVHQGVAYLEGESRKQGVIIDVIGKEIWLSGQEKAHKLKDLQPLKLSEAVWDTLKPEHHPTCLYGKEK